MKRDHTKLICDVGELAEVFNAAHTLESFLQNIVEMVAAHMHCPVCSIYLYYGDTQELVLSANHGLNPSCIGQIKMKLGEGLTGLSLKELRPIAERNASQNKNFKYFPGIGEENFESFLAVPIIRGTIRIGAMVIQNTQKDYFSQEDIRALRAITSQLATTIEMARLILSLESKRDIEQKDEFVKLPTFIKGKVGCEGFAYAPAIVIAEDNKFLRYLQQSYQHTYSLADFQSAVLKTETQLKNFQSRMQEELSDVASLIFSAQILMLKDQSFIESIEARIKQGDSVVSSIIFVLESYVKKFEGLHSDYLRQKAKDIQDIGRRLLDNLLVREDQVLDAKNKVIIASDLLPSDVLKLSSEGVGGIILLSGGVTSHVSILAQSLKVPLVIVYEPQLLNLKPQTGILLDAESGNIYIEPNTEILDSFKDKRDSLKLSVDTLDKTQTKDRREIVLLANINLLGDLKSARQVKAQGIGLYRTEFPFMIRSQFPTEEEQFTIYKKLIDGMPGKEITIRTLDVGGDKVLSFFQDNIKESNPFLGLRSIRFSLKHREVFIQQLRAILRAGLGADIRIMFPMISSLDEFLESKRIVKECMGELIKENITCHQNPKLGVMVELPSILEILEELAHEADFFSIGTNDFIQYMLAVDRTNAQISDLYLPHHPSVLRALKKIVDICMKYKKDVSICGDMAHDQRYLEYLIGIGLNKFSINPSFLPKVQKAISQIDFKTANQMTKSLLKEAKISQIEKII